MTMTFDAPSGRATRKHSHRSARQPDAGRGISHDYGDLSGSLLTKVIEGEIIPRLLLAHREMRPAPQRADSGGDVILTSESFARLVLASDSEEIVAHVETLLDRGISLERIFLDLLAPVARQLGQMWLDDTASFTDVTLGLSRLHRVLHEIGRRGRDVPPGNRKRRAFFAPVPGEQHTFGVSMLEEFFRHAGWQTACEYAPSQTSILEIAATQSLDIIGFSVGCSALLDPLSELIDKTRAISRNRDIVIMVGGGLFIDNHDLAARFGNAVIVTDGVRAVRVAEELVSHVHNLAAGLETIV